MNRYLLDTPLIYWWMTANQRLGKPKQRIIAKSEILVSTASIYFTEISDIQLALFDFDLKRTEHGLAVGRFTAFALLP